MSERVSLLPLVALPMLALLAAPSMPRWVFMWAMAFALYAGCKWLTYCEARVHGPAPSRARAIGYLVAWPGMDAKAFLSWTARFAPPRPAEWMVAALKFVAGAALIWVVAFLVLPVSTLLTIVFAETLAAGGNLARALCAFFAVFWTLRLIAGTFVLDLRPYLTTTGRRLGYHAINIVFAYLPIVYGLAASRPRWLVG